MDTSLAALNPNTSGQSQDEQMMTTHVEDDVVPHSPRIPQESPQGSIEDYEVEMDEDYCTEPGQVITTRLV